MNYLRMDLKVCEGCGALWLRGPETSTIYCRHCRARLSAFPQPKGRHRLLGPRKHRCASVAPAVVSDGGAR